MTENPLNGFRKQIKQACDQLADTLGQALEDIVSRVADTRPGFNLTELAKHLSATPSLVRNALYGPKKELFQRLSVLRKNTNNREERVYHPEVLTLLRSEQAHERLAPPALREKALKLYLQDKSFAEIAQKLGVGEPTVSKSLASIGILTPRYVSKHYPSVDDVMTKKIDGIRLYSKEQQREEMIKAGAAALGTVERVGYLGLEGPNFTSYILTSRATPIDPKRSLVAEHDRKAYNLMLSIARAGHLLKGGELFKGLNLYRGNLEAAVRQTEFRKHKYGWLNLDYEGGWAPEKGRTIEYLLAEGHVADKAVLFLTLNNEQRMRANCETDFGTDDQVVAATQFIYNAAEPAGYACEIFHERAYTSKITNTKPMLLLGCRLTRK